MSIIDRLSALPDEMLLRIFSCLDPSSLVRSSQTSGRWRTLADDSSVWFSFWEQALKEARFTGEAQKMPHLKESLKKLESQKLKSNEAIVDRIEAFVNQIALGQNGRFRCRVTLGANYKEISLAIKGSETPIPRAPTQDLGLFYNIDLEGYDAKEDCLALSGAGDGSLQKPESSNNVPRSLCRSKAANYNPKERVISWQVARDGPFIATLRFPECSLFDPGFGLYDLDHQTDMEYKIERIVMNKLEEFAKQSNSQKCAPHSTILKAVAAGAAILALGYTKLLLSSSADVE